jgi:single-stranded-DNA-specific exonuclease
MSYRWQTTDRAPANIIDELAAQTGLNRILLNILYQRNVRTTSEIDHFLAPDLSTGHDPFLMKGMHEAVTRIRSAASEGDPIRIHGDYDVDGVTAVALLVRVLKRLGANVDAYIPHRTEDGYGLSLEAIDQARNEGVKVLITVDCGISACREALHADELGMDLIVTDHHTPGSELPCALAVINPRQPGCDYPFKDLCGVGLAFKLACALDPPDTEPALLDFLDLVALGTTADVVSLLDENRVFVKYGLPQLGRTRWPGINALIDRTELQRDMITATQTVFTLAPRINAAGRVSDARDALMLFLTDDPFEAAELAQTLDKQNVQRKEIDRSTLAIAHEMIDAQGGLGDRSALVLCAEEWHAGVIGIVASRLAESYNVPTVLVAMEGDEGKGSARSIEGFDLHEALSACSEHLIEFGGHPRAAGLCLAREKINDFTDMFEKVAHNKLVDTDIQPLLNVDYEVLTNDLTRDFLSELNRLEPYGEGNFKPVLMMRGAQLHGSPRRVGPERTHLKFSIKCDSGYPLDAIGFGLGDRIGDLSEGTVDLAFNFEENLFRGVSRPQLRVKDIRKATS